MNTVHSCVYRFLLNFSFTYSVILSRLTSHPIPSLNPVYPSFSFHLSPSNRSFFSLSFSIVSINLYIGDVFVIGLAL